MFDIPNIMKTRLRNIRAKMNRDGLDVIFCASLRSLAYVGNIYQNLAWYVNTAIVVPASGDPFFVVPLSDRTRVEKETWISEIRTWNPAFTGITERRFEDVLLDYLRENRLEKGRLGVEGNLTGILYKTLTSTFPAAQLLTIDDMIQECMMIKDDYEISLMRKVGEICTIGFETARNNVRPGMTENELAGHMELAMRRAGCTGYWVPNQVGTGETVLLDHYPSDAVIQENHYVKVGVHPMHKLYCGDICNVMSLKKADAEYAHMCMHVEDASLRTIDTMKPGVLSSQLFTTFHDYMSDKGYPDACNWFLGHGLGTAHQKPLISPHDNTELKERMIIIFNALAQPKGANGYINEVMLLVTADGVEYLSRNPLGLVQL